MSRSVQSDVPTELLSSDVSEPTTATTRTKTCSSSSSSSLNDEDSQPYSLSSRDALVDHWLLGESCLSCGASGSVAETLDKTVCQECGLLYKEEEFVNKLTFEKDSDGRIHAQGAHLDLECLGDTAVQGIGGYHINKCGQDMTLNRNKKEMQARLAGLKCDRPDVMKDAWKIFKDSFRQRFTIGRKTIISACIFIACRMNGTSHTAHHFLPTSGGTLRQLRLSVRFLVTRLNIRMPLLDPSLSIERFCEELFADRSDISATHQRHIQRLAADIVKRMKKDWIDQGRRPAGVTAAAIVIACRVHNVDVGPDEISAVAGLTAATIRKRLNEFARTESAALNPGEFPLGDLPPDRFHPSHYEHLESEKKVVLDGSDRKMYVTALQKVVGLLTMANDPTSQLHGTISAEEKEDLEISLRDLLTTIEVLEHAAEPPVDKGVFRATDLSYPVTAAEFETGENIVLPDLMASLLTNPAEQEIRRENLMSKFGSLLKVQQERKAAKEAAAAKKASSPPRKRQKRTGGDRPFDRRHLRKTDDVQTKKIDHQRYHDIMVEDEASDMFSNGSWSAYSTGSAESQFSSASSPGSMSFRCKYLPFR